MRLLVIEDNPKMAAAVQSGLREHGFAVDVVHRGFEGEERAAAERYDLIVLDVMLPDRDGVDVCRTLRRRKIATPVLMLSALSATGDKITGLDAGADDYLTKPFELDELAARVRALLRRGQSSEARVLRYADVELDLLQRTVKRDGAKLELTPKELALLEYFLRNPDRVLPRTTIVERVWGLTYEPTSNVVDVYVSSLRRKLDRGFDPRLIHTVFSSGYRFGRPPQ
jgi:two-component system copper resistance phosphate regulon response regulator CusR